MKPIDSRPLRTGEPLDRIERPDPPLSIPPHGRLFRTILWMVATGLTWGTARAEWEWEINWDAVDADLKRTQAVAERFLPREWVESLSAVDARTLSSLLSHLTGALEDPDPEKLAALQPLYHSVLQTLRPIPAMAPLVSWMEAHADYLDMAWEVRRQDPAREPVRPPIVPPVRTNRPPVRPERPDPPTPPDRPKPPAQTADPTLRKWKPISDQSAWARVVSNRKQPAGAEKWVPVVSPVFRQEGMPEALVWLAEVESSFRPEARSPVGALGLFQLMPGTAEQLGLRVNPPPDERADPVKNARAAASYLRSMYGRFGSWPLALAAYNAGPGRVQGLLRRHQASSFEQIQGYLPSETQMYVPRMEAILRARTGQELRRLPPPGAL
ncbi:MAG: lytic transglycosylase domain-containing protein [Kiritimatiellia bacterium]|nr:lytic transglycosylase domain-containing protein [Kiritimatiellia bacterium]